MAALSVDVLMVSGVLAVARRTGNRQYCGVVSKMRDEAGFEQDLGQAVWLALGQVDQMGLSEAVTPDVEVRRLHWFDPHTGENIGLDIGSCEVGGCELNQAREQNVLEAATRHQACRP